MTRAASFPKVDVFAATHVADAFGPQHILKQYLKDQGVQLAWATCPFDYATIKGARITFYEQGQERAAAAGHANVSKGVISWIKDAWFIWRWGWRCLKKDSLFFGINSLHAAVGIVLKWLGKGNFVVYYVIDYTHQRFASLFLNWVYQRVCAFAARHADMIWNLSERMQAVHQRFGAKPEGNVLVPVGVRLKEVKPAAEREVIANRLIVVSALFESKGVQTAIRALTHLPQAHLVVVGTGPYEGALKALALAEGVAQRVDFKGMIWYGEALFREIAISRVALAPYSSEDSNYTYYADPSKPKEYLACGTPVVITKVPWIAEPIEALPMGKAIDDDVSSLVEACRLLLRDDEFWRQCRRNALAYMKDLDWSTVMERALVLVGQARAAKTPMREKHHDA